MKNEQFIRATRDRCGWKSTVAHVLEDMAQWFRIKLTRARKLELEGAEGVVGEGGRGGVIDSITPLTLTLLDGWFD
ncbi:hypothetical protein E2C01_100615 [Portunus trituberculatus]|uniref:Uncharacterized protein n=1 Tax=Portunus trituberculatus TaxID=210409 RepID=A0A5B7KDQ9_PORTR|nr:hypothetical protein [Portunus trituberculatus]